MTAPNGGPASSAQNLYTELVILDDVELVGTTEQFECSVCLSTTAPGEGCILRECLHIFCKECVANHVSYSEDVKVKCPYMDANYSCDSVIQDREVKALVSNETFEKFLDKSLHKAELQIENTFHCKTANCKGWCIYERESNHFECPLCFNVNCLTCHVIHEGLNCMEYQNGDFQDGPERLSINLMHEMVVDGQAMACPKCQVIIVKISGCEGISCSICRTDICWATRGPRWGPAGKGDTSAGCRCGVDGRKCHVSCRNCH